MLRIEKARRKRHCQHCGRDIPKDEVCIKVFINKSRSYCARCMVLHVYKLGQYHDLQKIKESIIEELL